MASASGIVNDYNVERARELLHHLEQGDEKKAGAVLDELSKLREDSLYMELGRLTREFHEALNSFRLDSRVSDLAEKDIPDARDRLNYVITMTGQAADRTLTAVESALPVCEQVETRAETLRSRWGQFTRRELDAAEFRELSRDVEEFFGETNDDIARLKSNLQDVLMAQDFQDLTGQIIHRVITLVEDVEKSLVELVRISGQKLLPLDAAKSPREAKEHEVSSIEPCGPPVPGVDGGAVSGQDEVDELLSSLGF